MSGRKKSHCQDSNQQRLPCQLPFQWWSDFKLRRWTQTLPQLENKHLLGLLQFIKSKIYRYSSHTTSLTRLGLHPLNSLDPHMPKTLCIPETLIPHPKPPHPDRVLYRILVTFLWTTVATPGFPRGGANPRETTNQLFGITFAKTFCTFLSPPQIHHWARTL